MLFEPASSRCPPRCDRFQIEEFHVTRALRRSVPDRGISRYARPLADSASRSFFPSSFRGGWRARRDGWSTTFAATPPAAFGGTPPRKRRGKSRRCPHSPSFSQRLRASRAPRKARPAPSRRRARLFDASVRALPRSGRARRAGLSCGDADIAPHFRIAPGDAREIAKPPAA